MHKNPASNKTQVDFKVGNAHVLAAWFVAQHGLQALARWLTLGMVVGLAFQTGNYRLDESLLTGKNGGEPLDATRSDAYFALNMLAFDKCTALRDVVPCVETVLHGAPRAHNRTNGVDMGVGGVVVPSSYEIVERHSLASLKALAKAVEGAAGTSSAAERAPRGGRFIVLDWLTMPQSAATVSMMEAAGLAGRACFSREQLVDACGYLATGWAAMLRALGDAFDTLECEVAAQLNSPAFIATSNAHLGLNVSGAVQLTSDQILELAAAINPDSPGQSAGWLHSPMPLNLFNTFFARTLAEEQFHGIVHMVVVNTQPQFTFNPSVVGGVHWFLAAWLINPAADVD